MQSLIPYTNKNALATDKKIFKSFAKILKKVNPQIHDEELAIIKECIDEDKVTAEELEYGFVQAYKDPERYGKVEWNDIWSHVEKMRKGEHTVADTNKMRKYAKNR